MTTTSAEAAAVPRLRLRTFGTLQLIGGAQGTILGDHGHQRRRLALLAVLAAAGERGRSRDQLLGLFWPDVSQSRARHSLEQLLYAIRTSLDGDVFTAVNPLRLNSAFISSDVGDFAAALERGDIENAVETHDGPFLEGFYLSDVPEFEQWMDAERGRIERSYTEALERLAKRAEDAKDYAAAARWLQKLIDADPVSSKPAVSLIRALMNAGDHAAALRYAERYEAIVAKELGTSVGPVIAGVVAEVRARSKAESVLVRGTAPSPKPLRASGSTSPETRDQAPVDPGGLRAAAPATQVTDEPVAHRGESVPHRFVAGRRAALYGIAVLAVATLVVAAWWLRPHAANGSAPAMTARSIAVLPLANLSGDPRDAGMIDGLSEELTDVLAKIDRLRVVAPTSAFVFRNSKLEMRQIADSLHVSHILEGGVQKIGQKLRVQVRLVDGRDGSAQWSQTYDRELKDIFLVQSEIAGAVARELDLRLGGRTVDALRRGPTQNIGRTSSTSAATTLLSTGATAVHVWAWSTSSRPSRSIRRTQPLTPVWHACISGSSRARARRPQVTSSTSLPGKPR